MKRKLIHTKFLVMVVYLLWTSLPSLNAEEYTHIQALFDSIKECRNDSMKIAMNVRLTQKISALLEDPSSFDNPFNQLYNLGKIYSDDKVVRIYTWSFPLEDKSYQYGGFIQYRQKGVVTTTPLQIAGEPIVPAENGKIDNKHWYGALYYKVFKVKKKRETYYIVLGWSGFNAATDFKIIEPIQFAKNGKMQNMGKMVFKETGRKSPFRIILEYNSDGKVALDFDSQKGKILFDHLSPIDPIYTGIRSYYGPDFTYDAFILKKGDWYFTENIDARNK